jgi:hypothetical protein
LRLVSASKIFKNSASALRALLQWAKKKQSVRCFCLWSFTESTTNLKPLGGKRNVATMERRTPDDELQQRVSVEKKEESGVL